MKIIALILSLLLLTSCSNPDTSGGVTLSRGGGGDWDNTFPNGSCKGPDQFDNQGSKTGCGWVHSDEGSHYITSCSNPETWDGVTLSRGCGNDSTNVFPYGSCEGPSADAPSSGRTGCGWISAYGKTHYFMPYADLMNADLRATRQWRPNLSGANLRGADLRGADLTGHDLSHLNLSGADLRDADLRGARLRLAILRDVDLRGAFLWLADLAGADLMDADLRDADLSGADLIGALFLEYADLSGVIANPRTTCPNGEKWGTTGNNCGF